MTDKPADTIGMTGRMRILGFGKAIGDGKKSALCGQMTRLGLWEGIRHCVRVGRDLELRWMVRRTVGQRRYPAGHELKADRNLGIGDWRDKQFSAIAIVSLTMTRPARRPSIRLQHSAPPTAIISIRTPASAAGCVTCRDRSVHVSHELPVLPQLARRGGCVPRERTQLPSVARRGSLPLNHDAPDHELARQAGRDSLAV